MRAKPKAAVELMPFNEQHVGVPWLGEAGRIGPIKGQLCTRQRARPFLSSEDLRLYVVGAVRTP